MAAMAVILLLALLIFFMAEVRRIFVRTDTLYVTMPSAAGLRAGSPVWIAGRTVGEVKNITVRPPDADSVHRVLIRIDVERRYVQHIRRDSEARVTSFRVIGDPVLDITPGSASAAALGEGDTLALRQKGTMGAVLARARSLQGSLKEILADSRRLGSLAGQRRGQATRLGQQLAIANREFADLVEAVQFGPLNTFSDPEFNRVLSSLGGTIGELRESFSRAADRARSARSDAGPAFDRLAARADTIQQAITRLQENISRGGGGLLIRAQKDSAIVKTLHDAQTQLDSLIAETKRNPLRFWF